MGQLALAPLLVVGLDTLGLAATFLTLGAVTGACALLGTQLSIPSGNEVNNQCVVMK